MSFPQPATQSRPARSQQHWLGLMVLPLLMLAGGCTTITIDEHRIAPNYIEIDDNQSVVVLGRRHSSDYETEPDLVDCVGDVLASGSSGLTVVPEQKFVDALYPWFEPRTAPMHVGDLKRYLQSPEIASAMDTYKVRYIIWIDGNTETTDSSGSIGCSITVGGAGCFGFGTWEKESDYEAEVWDYQKLETEGQISADASGTSYMPAVIVPIPIIARVQTSACKGLGEQLKGFFANQH
ncbi:hypothetical protein [Halioxenophilus sp. WMMB6]|uniref:hypothetical protein n=1 Tax=Halioxenophilus sp. WMMB6 TaxID=3073815 RepID=UPI00295F58AA|nr:hypothetical protein [Halioxenophilus sp. WMMB6]